MTLTWSISRDATLEKCERLYYYQYVVTARSNSRDPRMREIAHLKHVQSVAMWQGDVFHRAAADVVRVVASGRPPDVSSVVARTRAAMAAQWDFSAARGYLSDPKALGDGRGVALFEHEYDQPLSAEARDGALDRVSGWLERFVVWTRKRGLAGVLRRATRTWIEPDTFGPQAPGFHAQGAQVLTKVDLAVRSADGRFAIFDWKTGAARAASAYRTTDGEYQVTVYQLWPHLTLAVPGEAITATLVYVGADPLVEQTFTIDQNTRARALRRVEGAIIRARYLEGGAGAPPLMEEDFDLAAHVGICRWCSFKRVCQGGVATPATAPDEGVLEFDFGGSNAGRSAAGGAGGGLSSAGLFA
jgi:hypothetical protein